MAEKVVVGISANENSETERNPGNDDFYPVMADLRKYFEKLLRSAPSH